VNIWKFLHWPTASLGLMVVVGTGFVAPASSTPKLVPRSSFEPTACFTREATLTVEEQRLDRPSAPGGASASAQFLALAGFHPLVSAFRERLCTLRSVDAAHRFVRDRGAGLWQTAVQRAQGKRAMGTIDRYDDRPLYWARVSMTKALRQWKPPFEVTDLQRNALIRIFDYASRGISSVNFGTGKSVTRVLISGFDTFLLDDDIRHSNPSGANALQLDGRRFTTPAGTIEIQSVVFPVNWTDFDQGVVEDAFGPSLLPGKRRVDLIMTISQKRRGDMHIEKWAGGFRGGFPDNNRVMQFGPISRPAHWPQPYDSPQWIRTTLPYQQMIAAGTRPWPVKLEAGVCEWPAGSYPNPTKIRCRSDPSSGSQAASAPGGNYLSNESMYRSNRLRQGIGAWDVPGGHLHISALVYPPDKARLTSPQFEADRRATVDQTAALVIAAGKAMQPR
jgi:hypothetical protein